MLKRFVWRVLVLFLIIAVGSGELQSATDFRQKLSEQRQVLDHINKEIEAIAAPNEDQNKLRDLASNMNQVQIMMQQLQAQRGLQTEADFRELSAANINIEAARINQQQLLQTLKNQIQDQRALIQKSDNRLQELQRTGFLTDELRNLQAQLPAERTTLNQLEQQYRFMETQAAASAATYQQRQQWMLEEKRRQIQVNYDQKLSQLNEQYQKLLQDYQTLQAEMPVKLEKRQRLMDQYQQELEKYKAMQAQGR